MGRIPGFTAAIFPTAAMPNLNLVANLGLSLFLFLVGLEVDLRCLVSNWTIAASVGLAGMALPFGLGCALAVGLYNQFKTEPDVVHIDFGVYMLFVGVAMAITAFPVLCRILTELKLLSTPVGIIVLSAGVGNDVVGWILLALCVALVNSGTGLSALYVLLTCVGYVLFLVYAVRPAFIWVLRRNRALQDGPSQTMVALTLLIALASAFFTGIIGVHPIFGAFMAGLICPHEGGFAIKVTEKIEDLISAIFLPLYFALSGLNTNVGLLDSGIVWGYVIAVVSVAFFAKFIGASIAARFCGLVWRESFSIGALMSCKGLVELIVLNIGLQARILSKRTFTIFVVMALVTTFATTPLTSYLYPPWYQKKLEAWKRGEIDWDTGRPLDNTDSLHEVNYDKLQAQKIQKLMVYLRLDNMPTLLAFASLFGGKPQKVVSKMHPSLESNASVSKGTESTDQSEEAPKRPIEAYGLRLLSLTDRSSSVMQVSELDNYTAHDPVVNTFRTFGRLHNLAISGEVVVVPEDDFADVLTSHASESDLLLLPWSETGGMSEQTVIQDKSTKDKLAAPEYISFVNAAFEHAKTTTAVLVNKNFGASKNKVKNKKDLSRTYSGISSHSLQHDVAAPITDRTHHIFFPFFGGDDDRAALRLVLQLAENPVVTATIVHFEVAEEFLEQDLPPLRNTISATTKTAPQTTTTPSTDQDSAFFGSLRASLPVDLANRVVFEAVPSADPLKDAVARASLEVGQSPRNAGDLVVLGRNIGRKFNKSDGAKYDEIRSEYSAGSTLGVLAERVWDAKMRASVLVVKAGRA
jgi:Kef-type K+ transport system membrane component KefB